MAACNSSQNKTPEAGKYSVSEKPFGVFENQDITQYTITNPSGMQVSIINYGGTVTNIMTPDKDKVEKNKQFVKKTKRKQIINISIFMNMNMNMI